MPNESLLPPDPCAPADPGGRRIAYSLSIQQSWVDHLRAEAKRRGTTVASLVRRALVHAGLAPTGGVR